MKQENKRGRWVAISTGVISIAIAVVYLLVVFLLDRQGPLLPPPPEALGGAVIVAPAVVITVVASATGLESGEPSTRIVIPYPGDVDAIYTTPYKRSPASPKPGTI